MNKGGTMATTEHVDGQAVALRGQATAMVQWAMDVQVATKQDADVTMAKLAALARLEKEIVAYWEKPKKLADAAHKEVCRKENEWLAPCKQARALAGPKVRAWQHEQEQARLAAEARQAAEMARIESAARLARAREEAARRAEEDARQRAAEAQDAESRKAAMIEAEQARRAADAAAQAADRKEAQAVGTMAVAEPAGEKVDKSLGGMRRTWKAVLVDMSTLIAEAKPGTVAATLLEFNQAAANRLAVGTRGGVTVPGVRFYEDAELRVRAAK